MIKKCLASFLWAIIRAKQKGKSYQASNFSGGRQSIFGDESCFG